MCLYVVCVSVHVFVRVLCACVCAFIDYCSKIQTATHLGEKLPLGLLFIFLLHVCVRVCVCVCVYACVCAVPPSLLCL